MRTSLCLVLSALILGPAAYADDTCTPQRSAAVRRQFQREHPCPSTGKKTGACAEWIADHFLPFCASHIDTVQNLRWEDKAESLRRDTEEKALCRILKTKEGLCVLARANHLPMLEADFCQSASWPGPLSPGPHRATAH